MIGSLIIVFREVLEAGLIVGIVLAATSAVPHRLRWVFGGIGAGVVGSAAVAAVAGALSDAFEGMGQELFNAAILLVAVAMLSWHSLWMASHGRELAGRARAFGQAVSAGDRTLMALAIVVAVAVLREGVEVVLFLGGISVSSHDGPYALWLGGLFGLLGGFAVSLLLYRGLLAIPLRHFFTVTQIMITLLAAGMAGQAAALLAGDGLVPSLGRRLWDTSWLLPQSGAGVTGLIGRALHALVGYADRPPGIQVAAWLLTFVTLFLLTRPRRSTGSEAKRQRA